MVIHHEIIIGEENSGKSEVGELLSEHLGAKLEFTDKWLAASDEAPPKESITNPETDILKSQRKTIIRELGSLDRYSVVVAGESVPIDEELASFLKMYGRVIFLDADTEIAEDTPAGEQATDLSDPKNLPPSELPAKHRAICKEMADFAIKISPTDTPKQTLEVLLQRIGF